MSAMPQVGMPGARASELTRWTQLVLGIVCMVMIANLQYGWTLFVGPIDQKHHWGRAAIQVAFTLFVLFETWLVPFEGYLVDRFGPKIVVLAGGMLVGIAWVVNSSAQSLTVLYIGAIIGGLGAGAVYGTCVGNALRWFPDHRGLAAGLTAAGFGAGSALTVIPIQKLIQASGYEAAFFDFGIGQGLVVVVLAWLLFSPQPGQVPDAKSQRIQQTQRQYGPIEIIKEPVFWVMYLMFVLVASGGLMATAQLAPIATDFKIDTVPVSILGLTLPALTFALEAVGIFALYVYGRDPLAFVILSGGVFFAWGEIYSLFPSTCTDSFGAKFAAANAGLLYTAKGTAALLVPWANVLAAATGGWKSAFVIATVFNAAAAILALAVLKPMRGAAMKKSIEAGSAAATGAG